MKIHIHFGAHKTATTFLQSFLTAQRKVMRAQGVAYIPLNELRKIFYPTLGQLLMPRPAARQKETAALLRERIDHAIQGGNGNLAPIHTLILSDENFAGPLSELSEKGTLYPQLRARLGAVESLYPGHPVTFFFCIRDYADFLPSCYCELLRTKKITDFPEFLSGVKCESISWPVLLRGLLSAGAGRKVCFWRYEDFKVSAVDVVEALSTVRLDQIVEKLAKKARPSLTRKGIAVLQACGDLLTAREYGQLAGHLAERIAFDDDGGKLVIEEPALASRLRLQYTEDYRALTQASQCTFGGVRMLTCL